MKIPTQIINIINFFLENRRLQVKMEDRISIVRNIKARVSYFLFYVRHTKFSKHTPSTSADDTTYYYFSMNKHHAAKYLQTQVT